MMMVKLLEFSRKVSDAYDRFDLSTVYQLTLEFMTKDVSELYLEFSKYRRRRLNATESTSTSTQAVLHEILNTLVLTAAPILCFSCQEAFDEMPVQLFSYVKPPTVF